MKTKNRKLNREELDLWRLITKDDKKLGTYTEDLEEKKINILEETNVKVNKIATSSDNKKKYVLSDDIQVNKRMRVKLERGLIRPEATLDLHGKTIIQAQSTLNNFVMDSIKKGIRCILIITGKKKTQSGSKGVIRENLPSWLKEKELANSVLFHCFATNRDGADGARYVLLRKKEKVFYD